MSNNLTIKQERFAQRYVGIDGEFTPYTRAVRKAIFLKLDALDNLWRLFGFSENRVCESERNKRFLKYGSLIGPLWLRLSSDDTPDFARAAIGRMFDYIIPGWRKHVDDRVLGYVVDRQSSEVRAWRKRVVERDGRKCVKCGETESLHAHHILRWADHPALRLCIDNGITLCEPCHLAEHGGSWSLIPRISLVTA